MKMKVHSFKRHYWSPKRNTETTIQSTPQNLGKLTSETTFAHSKVVFRPYVQNARFQILCGDWDGVFTYYALNASSREFIFGFDPFRIGVMCSLYTLSMGKTWFNMTNNLIILLLLNLKHIHRVIFYPSVNNCDACDKFHLWLSIYNTLPCKIRSIMQTIFYKNEKTKNTRKPVLWGLALSFWKIVIFAIYWIISCGGKSYLRLKTNLSLCVFLRCAHLDSAQ